MSTADAGAGAENPSIETVDYDEMLETLDVAIAEAKRKIEEGRIRDPEREKVRCKQWRSLGYLINVRRQVANDRDLQELAEQVERLKQRYESNT